MLIEYKGHQIHADEEERDKILKYFWTVQKLNGKYVAVARESYNKTLLMHRYLTTTDRAFVTMAIDGNYLNCRKVNLRIVTRAAKSHIAAVRVNASGFRGVTNEKHCPHRWRAQIAGQSSCGHASAEEAAKEYDRLARALYGKDAVTNFDELGNLNPHACNEH